MNVAEEGTTSNSSAVWSDDTKGFLDHFKNHTVYAMINDRKDLKVNEDGSKRPDIIHAMTGYDQNKITMDGRNKDLYGVFFAVNALNPSLDLGKTRTDAMWIQSRTLFVDDDTPRKEPRSDFKLEPSLVVRTSGSESGGWKYHYYWLMEEDNDIDKDAWKAVQRGLVQSYEVDQNVKDTVRVLRLPGYDHMKGDPVKVVWTGCGKRYAWDVLESAFPPVATGATGGTESAGGEKVSKSRTQRLEEIYTGEVFQDNLIAISYQDKQCGVLDKTNIENLQFHMNKSLSPRDARWQARYDDIPRIVTGATLKDENKPIDMDGLGIENGRNVVLPHPPGKLGELVNEAYEMAPYQYNEVAIVSAIGTIAGVCGRKFNVSKTGLNVYLTLIMTTGMGKDALGDFVDSTLHEAHAASGYGTSYIGAGRFTGPKGVLDMLNCARSQVCVLTEAGLLLQSQAGDQTGLSRVMLSLYSRSGKDKWSKAERYSEAEKSIPPMRAPALTIIGEATPSTLLSAFQSSNSLEKGEISRQSIYRVFGDKPHPNEDVKTSLSDDHKARIGALTAFCGKCQNEEDPEALDVQWEGGLEAEAKLWKIELVDKENELRSENEMQSIITGRAWLKAAKFAAISAVYNHKPRVMGAVGEKLSYDYSNVTIKREDWEWGKEMALTEIEGIDRAFGGGDYGDKYGPAIEKVAGCIIKILKNGYKTKNKQVDKRIRDHGWVTASAVKQAVNNAKVVQTFEDSSKYSHPRTGCEKILIKMVNDGLLLRKPTGTMMSGYKSQSELFRITPDFKMMYSAGEK